MQGGTTVAEALATAPVGSRMRRRRWSLRSARLVALPGVPVGLFLRPHINDGLTAAANKG